MSRFTVVLFFLLVFVAGPAAAGKFDLTPYFGPIPTVGDFRVYELSTGDTRTFEVVEVEVEKKSFRYVTEITQTGLPSSFNEDFLIPGKRILFGDRAGSNWHFDLKKPLSFIKFKVKPEKMNKSRAKAKLFSDGAFVGKATFQGEWSFEGLAPLDTPAASFADTAVTPGFLSRTVKDKVSGDVTFTKVEQVAWRARDLGDVAFSERTRIWVNQVLISDTGWIEAWLIDGSLAGQPIP